MTVLHFSALLGAALVAWGVELGFKACRWLAALTLPADVHDVEGDDDDRG